MQVVGGDWPLKSVALVQGGSIRVTEGLMKKTSISLSQVAEIESINPATLAAQPASIRGAASLAIGRKSRGQVVLITLSDGRLLLVECAPRDVEALLALSAKMNAKASPNPHRDFKAPMRASAPTPVVAAPTIESQSPALPDGEMDLGPPAADSAESAAPVEADNSATTSNWSPLRSYLALGGLLVVGGCFFLVNTVEDKTSKVDENTSTSSSKTVQPMATDPAQPLPMTSAQASKRAEVQRIAATRSFASTTKSFAKLAKPCDDVLGAFAHPQSANQGYSRAIRAEGVCGKSASDLSEVKFQPPIPDAARDELNTVSGCFGHAYGSRVYALESAKAFFNGDERPSVLGQFQGQMRGAVEEGQACAANLVSLEIKYGYVEGPLAKILGKSSRKLAADADRRLRQKQAASN